MALLSAHSPKNNCFQKNLMLFYPQKRPNQADFLKIVTLVYKRVTKTS